MDRLNDAIYLEYVKNYKSEQEDLMRVAINVAAYQINVLDKVSLLPLNLVGEAHVGGYDQDGR